MYEQVCEVFDGDVRVVGHYRESDSSARWIVYLGAVEVDRFGKSGCNVEKVKVVAGRLLKKYSSPVR